MIAMADNEDFDDVMRLIAGIRREVGGEPLIYRGTPRIFPEDDDINSSIYRKYKDEGIFNEKFLPIDIEKEIVERARRFFKPGTEVIEILTDIRHFSGDTTLIDFTRDMMVALFFACNSNLDEPGQIIVVKAAEFPLQKSINYEDKPIEPHIIEPARTDRSLARTIAQSSVFVHAPKGYIEWETCKYFDISVDMKSLILEYLRGMHNISAGTIYNDLPGFLANEKNFETAQLHFYRGVQKGYRGDHEGAIDDYDEATYFKPDLVEAHYNRGVALNNLGQHEKAIADYDEAIRLRPDFVEAHYNRGVALNNLGQHEKAIADYDEAIRLRPDLAEAYNNRGSSWNNIGQHKEAIADYEEAIRLNPNHAEGYYNRGNAWRELGQYDKAIADYEGAIHHKSDYASAYNNLGTVRYALGQYEKAIADYDEAIRLKPDYADAYSNRGEALVHLGQHEGAIADCDEAIRLQPDDAEAYHNRGVARHALGQHEEAKEDFNKARQLGYEPDDDERQSDPDPNPSP